MFGVPLTWVQDLALGLVSPQSRWGGVEQVTFLCYSCILVSFHSFNQVHLHLCLAFPDLLPALNAAVSMVLFHCMSLALRFQPLPEPCICCWLIGICEEMGIVILLPWVYKRPQCLLFQQPVSNHVLLSAGPCGSHIFPSPWILEWKRVVVTLAESYSLLQHVIKSCPWLSTQHCTVIFQLMDAVMLQLSRARNRLTTPAILTLPEIASSGLTVSMW